MKLCDASILSSATTSINDFVPLDKIGEGSFSSVYKVRRINDNQIYALKKVKITTLKEKEKINALNEVRILASLASQYIVEYKQAFFDERLNLLCIVMEWANQGDLQKKIQSFRKKFCHFPERQIWKAASHIIQGLHSLHSRSILHRDIKSANIFISDGKYKLGDLNVSKIQKSSQKLAYTQTGTPYYASPQVWRDEPYDSKSDIWSLGCIIYEICNYRPPFKGKDLDSLYKSVQKGVYDSISPMYSKQLSDLIGFCLRKNARQRLSTEELLSSGILQRKCRQFGIDLEENQTDPTLLKTIKLPVDLKDLKKKLPKSKYEKRKSEFPFIKTKKPTSMSSTQRKEKNPQSLRKFSQQRNKAIMQQLSQLRKLSQPGRCYSQRYEDVEESMAEKKMKESSTDRKILSKKSQESLAELEKKINIKRKQLRKIGSIQKLQSMKNVNSFCERGVGLKKSVVHTSNILLKSPTSTQPEPPFEEKCAKKCQLNKITRIKPMKKVNSTPYMAGLSDAPRMKRILQGLQHQKKSRQLELKSRIPKYIPHKY